MTTYVFGIKGIVHVFFSIGHLHDGVILLLRSESFGLLLSCANEGSCYSNLIGTIKFKYERKKEMNSGLSKKKDVNVQIGYWWF